MTETEKVTTTDNGNAKSDDPVKITESEIPKDADNGHNKSEDPDVAKKIVKQVDFYFGDFNMQKDKFLKGHINDNEDGWIDMATMLKFQRLSKLSTDVDAILTALKASELVEVDFEGKRIRRSPKLPLPEEETAETKKAKSVYVKGFDKENSTIDSLIEFFDKFDGVVYVNKRNFTDNKTKAKGFKGSVFVIFKDRPSAEAFMALEEVKGPDGQEALIRKWQADYFVEKDAEFEEKKKKRQEGKDKAKKVILDAKGPQAEPEQDQDDPIMPKGAVMFMSGFNTDTMREDIKKQLNVDFNITRNQIAFVDFEKGQTEAHLRFKEEDEAKNLAVKMAEKFVDDKKFVVKGAEIEYRVLEGDEESKFLENAIKGMKERRDKPRGHKRRTGGGGRGGKRPRMR